MCKIDKTLRDPIMLSNQIKLYFFEKVGIKAHNNNNNNNSNHNNNNNKHPIDLSLSFSF